MPPDDGTSRLDCRVNASLPRGWCRKFGRSVGGIPHLERDFPHGRIWLLLRSRRTPGKVHASGRAVVG
jgi:hypothetical protein